MIIILAIISASFNAWASGTDHRTPPDYEKLPVAARKVTQEFYDYSQNLLDNNQLSTPERNVVAFFQQAVVAETHPKPRGEANKLKCPIVTMPAISKLKNAFGEEWFSFELQASPEQHEGIDLNQLYSGILNNPCAQLVLFFYSKKTREQIYQEETQNLYNYSYSYCLYFGVSFLEANKDSSRTREYQSLKRHLNPYNYLTATLGKDYIYTAPLNVILTEGEQARLNSYEHLAYDRLYQGLYPGFNTYQSYGTSRRRSDIAIGLAKDALYLLFVGLAGSSTHVSLCSPTQPLAQHHQSISQTLTVNPETTPQMWGLCETTSPSRTAIASLATAAMFIPTNFAVAMNQSEFFTPSIYRVENKGVFNQNIKELARWVATRMLANELRENQVYTNQAQSRVIYNVLAAVSMQAAQSINATTPAELLFKLLPHSEGWKSWTWHHSAYAKMPIELLRDKALLTKTFGEQFEQTLWQ